MQFHQLRSQQLIQQLLIQVVQLVVQYQTASGTTAIVGVAGSSSKLVSTRSKLTVTPTAVGTYTYSITPSGGSNTTALTWTVVVEARPALTAAATTDLAAYAYYADGTIPSRGNWAEWSITTDAACQRICSSKRCTAMSVKVVQGNGNTTYAITGC